MREILCQKTRLIIMVAVLGFKPVLYSQQLSGKIIDGLTNQGIAYVSIVFIINI